MGEKMQVERFEISNFLKGFECKSIPSNEIARLRRYLKGGWKRIVKDFILDQASICGNRVKKYKYYELHHILPLSLGGTNNIENLALVHPDLHKSIHFFIDTQGQPSRYKQKLVWVPVLPNQLWTAHKWGKLFNLNRP